MPESDTELLAHIRACTVCSDILPLGPNPVCNFRSDSKILLVGQAPGLRVHESGIPWNDASGERLRMWLGVGRDTFYDPQKFAIVPMAFCYPGRKNAGDAPPPARCAAHWMERVLGIIKSPALTLLTGQYAQKYFLQSAAGQTLTETVRNWKVYLPEYFVLPHPSPRNNIWLAKHSWFEKEVVPDLQRHIQSALES